MRLAGSRLGSFSWLHPQTLVRHHHIRLPVPSTPSETNTVLVNLLFRGSEGRLHVFHGVVLVSSQPNHRRPRHGVLSLNFADVCRKQPWKCSGLRNKCSVQAGRYSVNLPKYVIHK